MKTFEATRERPGPDGNDEQAYFGRTQLQLKDPQVVGRPYQYLEGRAVPYDTWADVGWFMEQHMFGSFERSTKGGSGVKLPLLLFHDNRKWPAGHAEKWTQESDGLHGTWRLNDTPEAQQAARLADNGDLVGLSIGFAPIRSKWEMSDDWAPDLGPDHMDRVTRLESRLVEVSMTPTPAFADANVTLVRHRPRYSAEGRREMATGPTPYKNGWRDWVDQARAAGDRFTVGAR
jgi:hypothetical protein